MLVMDGQYIRFINKEDICIAGPFIVNSLAIYEEGNIFEVVDKGPRK